MKGIFNYFNTLFKKYDLWLFFSFIFFITYSFYKLGATETNDLKFIIYVWPIPFLLLNLGNVKNKVNLLDVLSIIAIFLNVYFCIAYKEIYSIVVTILLFLQVIYKGSRDIFERDEKENAKDFFFRLNYRFPLVALILISFSLDFIFYYVLDNTDYNFNVNFEYAVQMLSTTIPIFYLILISFMDRTKLNLLDYIFFIFLAFLAGGISLLDFSLLQFTFPFFAFVLRSNSFEGENHFRKRKYVSCLLEKYNALFPFLFGFSILLILSSSYPQPLWTLSQPVYMICIAAMCILLTSLYLLLGRFKAKEIHRTDYILLLDLNLLFFTFIYVLATVLGITTREKNNTYLFDNLISLVCLGVLGLGMVILLIAYYLRYKHFMQEAHHPAPLKQEEVSLEPFEVSLEETTTESVQEASLEVDHSKDKKAEVLDKPTDQSRKKPAGKLTFLEELMLSSPTNKKFYSEVKNYALSYGISDNLLENKEIFRKKGIALELRLDKKGLCTYLSTAPEPWIERGFSILTVSYKEAPVLLNVNSRKAFREFKIIFDDIMRQRGVFKNPYYEEVDFVETLLPNGSAVLKELGFAEDRLLEEVNAKSIPVDLPKTMEQRVPTKTIAFPDEEEVAEIALDTLCNYFTGSDCITLELLKEKKLIKNANSIRILARGTLDKPLTIYADSFEEDAVKMIYLTNGTAVKLLHR